MESRNNGGKKLMVILIIILSIISIGSLGYTIYDKVIDDNKSSNDVNTDEKQNDNKGSNDVSTNEKEVKVDVATEYEYNVYALGISQKSGTEKEGTTLFKVKLPKIVNGTLDAEKLNKKMLTDTLKNEAHAVENNSDKNNSCYYEGHTTTYEYLTKNNVLAIYIYSDDTCNFPGSGNGTYKSIYFYNIKTGKIIDKMSEAGRLMEAEVHGVTKNYDDLDDFCTDYSIKNGVLSFTTLDYCV